MASRSRVYFIEHEHGLIKIGVSDNPQQRLQQIESIIPYSVELIISFESEEAYFCEQALHKIFQERKVKGEWFNISKDIISSIESINYIKTTRELTTRLEFLEDEPFSNNENQCSICGFSGDLRNHYYNNEEHRPKSWESCDFCGERFNGKAALNTHKSNCPNVTWKKIRNT